MQEGIARLFTKGRVAETAPCSHTHATTDQANPALAETCGAMNFHCELAAILSDELVMVSGWAAGATAHALRVRIGENGKSQDITDWVIRYYRGDVTESMREKGMALDCPPAHCGVMALAPLQFSLAEGASYSLEVENGSGHAVRIPLERLEASNIERVLEHLSLRFPYFLGCYSKDALERESRAARSLLQAYLEAHSRGIEKGLEHRVIDSTDELGISVEYSCVLRRQAGLLLVVSGHIAVGTATEPVFAWNTEPALGGEWFSLEAAEAEGSRKLADHGLYEARRFIGVLPLGRLSRAPLVARLRAAAGPATVEVCIPVTAPIGMLDFAARVGTSGTAAVVEVLARNGVEGSLPGALGIDLRAAAMGLKPSTLTTTAKSMPSGPSLNAAVDYAFVVASDCVVALGWALSPSTHGLELTCHDASGKSWDRRRVTSWMERRDVAQAYRDAGYPLSDDCVGFCTVFDRANLANPGRAVDDLYFSVEDEQLVRSRFRPWNVVVNSGDWKPLLSKMLTLLKDQDAERWLAQLAPLLSRTWSRRPRPSQSVEVHTFGSGAASPAVSVIVPLYGRVDLMEYQLACFATDPSMSQADLVYFLDDPRQADTTLELAKRCHRIFGVPFRLLLSEHNLGFAGANNCAATYAKADVLLLLNSDVMPKSPGWLPKILDAFRALPEGSVLGARLLFEDGSIQHAGITFESRTGRTSTLWLNDHPFKGYPARLVNSRGVERVPAVTAACMMVSRSVFDSAGGLSDDYIYADFEDSDFCLKLLQQGHQSFVAHDVELYHLERQSVSSLGAGSWRDALVLVNAWIHTNRWGGVIAQMQDQRT